MIITWLTGGLGNQMFQYAAGLALAEHRRTVLKLDVSWFREDPEYEPHNRYALSCFNITEQFAVREEIERLRGVPLTKMERWSAHLGRALRLYQYANRYASKANLHCAESFEYYPDSMNNRTTHIFKACGSRNVFSRRCRTYFGCISTSAIQ